MMCALPALLPIIEVTRWLHGLHRFRYTHKFESPRARSAYHLNASLPFFPSISLGSQVLRICHTF